MIRRTELFSFLRVLHGYTRLEPWHLWFNLLVQNTLVESYDNYLENILPARSKRYKKDTELCFLLKLTGLFNRDGP